MNISQTVKGDENSRAAVEWEEAGAMKHTTEVQLGREASNEPIKGENIGGTEHGVDKEPKVEIRVAFRGKKELFRIRASTTGQELCEMVEKTFACPDSLFKLTHKNKKVQSRQDEHTLQLTTILFQITLDTVVLSLVKPNGVVLGTSFIFPCSFLKSVLLRFGLKNC